MEESFLKRWARLKRAPVAAVPAEAAPMRVAATPPLPLPAVDGLELSSDFVPFMQAEVAEGLRRAALQKLFAAEHFNVMDGLDVYVEDYNSFEPIGEEMLRQLMQARGLLFDNGPEPTASAAPEPDAGKPDAPSDAKDQPE